MNDHQLSEFEDEARQVGRKSLPPEWRAEILDAAMRDSQVRATVETEASLSEAIELMRRSVRRAMWGMAACIVVILFLIALLFRSRDEPRMAQSWMDVDSARMELSSPSRSVSPNEAEKVRELIHPMLLSSGTADPEPEPNAIIAYDSAHNGNRVDSLLAAVDEPKLAVEGSTLSLDTSGGGVPMENPPEDSPTNTVLGQHADNSSRENTTIAGGVFAGRASTEGKIELDRLASRRGIPLSDSSQIGGVSHEQSDGVLSTREDYEADNAVFHPIASGMDGKLVAGLHREREEALLTPLETKSNSAIRPLGLRSGVGDEFVEADFGFSSGSSRVRGRANPGSDRDEGRERAVPTGFGAIARTTVNETEFSNNITEEVRYQIDMKDPVGDPATTREIGVTVAVTPNLLPDGTIRMKMRPRSAQNVQEIIGQSGNRYPRVSEAMRETIARVPQGHSLVVGGFYGEVRSKDHNKVPLLGDIPAISLFFKGEDAPKEPSNLLFVVTPTTLNDQVEIDTKVLAVNPRTGERTGLDWSPSLGAAGVSFKAIGSLNSLLGVESPLQEVIASDRSEGDGPIVLSSTQVEGVLGALSKGGLARQISNPTLIAEENEQATISLIDRVPIITTTISKDEVSPPVPAPDSVTPEEIEKNAAAEPWSTFSLNVSDVSFKLAKAALSRGEWPAADQVRVEEFVNAFDYGDPAPNQQEKMACKLEQAAHPFLQQRNLLRVSMRTAALGRTADTPLRLTVLLDNSGSMDRSDRVDSVKNAFRLLASELNPRDLVTLIGFARTPRLLADRVAGNKVAELAEVVDSTPSAGGTNLELALELGIAKAKEQMLAGGQNRIILLTDGAANLGNAEPDDLAKLVESMRQQGIAFDACGVGAEGLNDDILESLTRKGDGRYYFLDRPEDADDGFARQIAGALRPAARNVKVQVHFNPNRVGRYTLYGFEKHLLAKEDFRDDSVDAAELAAHESGNAIYQVEVLPEGRGDIGTVSVRFQDTESGQMIEWEWLIPYRARVPRLEESAASLRLASGAALLGEKLKGSPIGESVEMARLGKLINRLTSDFPSDARVKELVQMASQARELIGE